MVAFFWLGDSLRPAPFWTMQDTWSEIFGFVPRVTVASWVSFLVSENLDAYIFSWFKKRTGGRHFWARNVFSSLPSLAIDTFIFIPLAFWGVASLWPLIMGQVLLKWLVGFINIPFMYINKSVLVSKNCMAQRWFLQRIGGILLRVSVWSHLLFFIYRLGHPKLTTRSLVWKLRFACIH